jgi:hypothetical protein
MQTSGVTVFGYSRCVATGCMTGAVTFLARTIPLCTDHLREARNDLVQRDMIPASPKRKPSGPAATAGRQGLVYYGRTGDLLKIGTTTSPARRWDRLRRDLGSFEVLAAEPGGANLELQRHAQFIDLRVRMTESFRYEVALQTHVNSLVKASPDWWETVVLPVHNQVQRAQYPGLRRK